MFKKLKKKIEEEASGGLYSPGGTREMDSHGPGLASPLRLDQPPGAGSSPSKKDFDTMSMSSGTSEPREATSKEEVLRLLMKRTDTVRKLEGKITDLAALIKEKNRSVDKLEAALEKQSTDGARQVQELNEQLSAARARRKDSISSAMDRRDEALLQELEDLKKHASALEHQASMADSMRERFYQQEEENDESLGLATQEAAKVKHLLLNTQEELVRAKTQLRETTELRNISSKKVNDLESEVQSLMQQIASLTTTSEDVAEANQKLRDAVDDMRSQKQGVERQVLGVQRQHTERARELAATQKELAALQERYQITESLNASEQGKMKQLLTEREERISRLQDTTETLEQRLKNGQLSGDDRVTALELQRSTLEEKISEARDQISALKLSSGENTQQLQQQIESVSSSLEDKEAALKEAREDLDTLRYITTQQISELEHRLEEAHRKAKSNWDQLAERERQMEKQRIGFENELLKAHERSSDLEAELNVKVTSLETEVKALEKARQQDRKTAHTNMQGEWLEREIDLERRLSGLEGEVERLKGLLGEKDSEISKLQHQLSLRDRQTAHTAERLKNVEAESKSQKIIMEQHKTDMLRATRDCHTAVREREDALENRSSMAHEVDKVKLREAETRREAERELRQRDTAIAGLERAVEELSTEVTDAQSQLSALRSQQSDAASDVESAQVSKLHAELAALEAQLADKNKTIKMQQQRMSDLKKTLQREFKVQALPNDDHPPPPPLSSSHHYGAPPSGLLSKSNSTPQGLNTLPDNYIHKPNFSNSQSGAAAAKYMQRQVDMTMLHLHNGSDRGGGGGGGSGNDSNNSGVARRTQNNHSAPLEYNRDINFEYLRHVVLKFMLSRETEALHLIKAVSVLLDFTHDEQQLLKETIEYKMSWFGGFKTPTTMHRTQGGQMAKTIPPSY